MKAIVICALAAFFVSPVAISEEPFTAVDFVARASQAGLAEVELGKLAAQKGTSSAVKQFGQRMVKDHTSVIAELRKLATSKKIPVAVTIDPGHMAALEKLRARSGTDFDEAFAQQMVIDHNQAVALFSAGASLTDEDVAEFATNTLSTLREHQQEAEELRAER